MSIWDILNYISVIISNIEFILATFIILLVATCFLGRYVVITKKMIIAAFGTVLLSIICNVAPAVIIYFRFPEAFYASDISEISKDVLNSINVISYYAGFILNAACFLYAFIIYLFAFKEKKILRAIEAIVCLYLYYGYINNLILNTIIYIMGGDYEKYSEFLSGSLNKSNPEFNIKLMLIYVCVSFAVTVLILLLLYFGYYKKSRFYVIGIKSRIFFVIWLFVFYIFPAIPVYGTDDAMKFRLLSYIFGVLIPVVGVIAPSLLIMTAAEKSLKEKNEYQETYLNAELEYIEQYKRTQTETRAFRHDIINNLSLTNMMLDEGRTQEAGEHLKSLLGNVRALSPSIITGDEMLDCIVAMKADKMKEMGIAFSTDGVVDGGLHMKPMDVCSIFANALDNAIEACSHLLPEAKEDGSEDAATEESAATENNPHVDMKIKRTEKFFVINIANSAKGKVDVEKLLATEGYTSKKDTEHHGFGLRNIRRTVEEYDGLLKAESKDDEFSLAIMIPRKTA